MKNLEIKILNEINKMARTTTDLSEGLKRVGSLVVDKLKVDICSIYLLEEDGEVLVLKATNDLRSELVNNVKVRVGEGVVGWVAEKKTPVKLENIHSDMQFEDASEIERDKYKSLLAVPIMDIDHCLGVIIIQSVKSTKYSKSDIRLLSFIAVEIVEMIQTTQLYHNVVSKLSRLTKLYEIGKALNSTLELEKVLDLIVRISCEVVNCSKGSIVRLIDPETNKLEIKEVHGLEEGLIGDILRNMGEGIEEKVVENGEPLLVRNVEGSVFSSTICAPLITKGKTIGTLTVYNKNCSKKSESGTFSEEDLQFISTLASQASIAIENATNYEKAERLAVEKDKKVRELSILFDIGKAMRSTIKLDRLLDMILTAVTIGHGLGFNRAFLLLVNERANILQGMLGISPSNVDEAFKIWEDISQQEKSLEEWMDISSKFANLRGNNLNQLVKKIRIPIEGNEGIFARAVLEKKAFNVLDGKNDPQVNLEVLDKFGSNSFAVVPLIAKDKVVGVIAVDNLYNQKPITDEDVEFLKIFANQAGLAIYDAKIYSALRRTNVELHNVQERLFQSEKLAIVGELAASVAHEIRNPLVSIGGFARRLDRNFRNGDRDKIYSKIIVKEVSRLEKILDNILAFSRDSKLSLEENNINEIIKETLLFFDEEFREKEIVVEDFFCDIPYVLIDPQQLRQVFLNIISNSMQAMKNGGILTVKTEISSKSPNYISIEISDTGGGVSTEVLSNIFNPFFTTKSRGTGLGLALSHRIIKSHGGSVKVDNRMGEGLTFIINLPRRGEKRERR